MENDEQKRDEVVESPEESNWVDEWNAGTITGIVVSSIFVFIVVIYLVSLVYNAKHSYRPISSLEKFAAVQNIVSLMGTALCLFIRSLRRGFNFWRGLLTIIGGFIMLYGVGAFFFFGVSLTSSRGFGRLMVMLFVTLIGASILTCGFKSKKG